MFESLESSLSLDASDWTSGLSSASKKVKSFGGTASDSFDEVGDEAKQAGNRAKRARGGITSLAKSMGGAVAPATLLSSQLDDVGDEAKQAGKKSRRGATGFGVFSVGLGGVTAKAGAATLSLGTVATVIGAVGAATTAALPAVLAISGGLAGIGIAMGAILGTGFLAWGEGFQKTMKSVKKEVKGMLKEFGQKFVPLLKDAVKAIPGFVRAILDALGPLDKFVQATRKIGSVAFKIIPKLVGMLTDMGRLALPAVMKLTTFLLNNLLPAFRSVTNFGSKVINTITRFAGTVGTAGSKVGKFFPKLDELAASANKTWQNIQPFISTLTNLASGALPVVTNAVKVFVNTLIDLGRVVLSVVNGNFTKALDILRGRVVKIITGAWNWITSKGVALGKQALAQLGTLAIKAFTFGKNNIVPVVKNAIKAGWNWITTQGVTLGKQALTRLGTLVVEAFNFGKNNILPKVKSAIKSGWNWITTQGVTLGKQALTQLGNLVVKAFNFGENNILPKVKSAIKSGWNWITTQGVTLGKQALTKLGNLAIKAFTFAEENILPPVKNAVKAGWNWVKSTGVTLGKNAMGQLGNLAVKAFNFGETNILPVVKGGINVAWNWVKNNGASVAKQALNVMASGAMAAFKFSQNHLLPVIQGAVDSAFTWVKTQGLSIFKQGFKSLGSSLGTALVGYLNVIPKAFKNVVPKVREWLKNNGTDVIKGGFEAIGKGVRTLILGMFAIPGIVGQAIVSTITGIKDWLEAGGATKLKNAFISIVTGIVEYLKNDALSDLKGAAEFLFDGIMAAAEGLYKGLIGGSLIPDMFEDIASFIRNFDLASAAYSLLNSVWSEFQNWKNQVKTIVNGLITDIKNFITGGAKTKLVSAFKTLGRGIQGAMEKAASWAISGFNDMMPDQIGIPEVSIGGNSISLPSTKIAGQKIGGGSLSIPSATVGGGSIDIPQLANGGIVDSATLAMIGEGNESEAVMPLSRLDEMSGNSGETVIQLDGDATTKLLRGEAVKVVERDKKSNSKAIDRSRNSFE